MKNELNDYNYRGARVTVLMHEDSLHAFIKTWKQALNAGIKPPPNKRQDYDSMHTLLHHVINWARKYMVWVCQQLELPDPQIKPVPDANILESQLDDYLNHLLQQWRKPLKNIEPKQMYLPTYKSPWKIDYCIDAMMEHAVLHPRRHAFQLQELME